jgi:hypothetical protein
VTIAGYGKTEIRYDMFDIVQNAAEAKRLAKCERIYHRGQQMAWDGKDVLQMLLDKHGGIHIAPEKKEALKRVFAIIMWGELAAWKISAQLADRLVPLEAKMAATSQSFDEARHFYVMHDYLTEIGYVPERMDRAPQALLDLVLDTDSLAHKILGMQLMIETIALTIFQSVREIEVEPVMTELMRYYERDEARHVGLGMQYLPSLMEGMGRRKITALILFQCRVMFWALWEVKVLEKDFKVLGIDPRGVIERGRQKQLVALNEAFGVLGFDFDRQRNPVVQGLNAAVEVLFPAAETRGSRRGRWKAAWRAFWEREGEGDREALEIHARHAIQTARGVVAPGESLDGDDVAPLRSVP